jgi:S1-C subfamily serine protease
VSTSIWVSLPNSRRELFHLNQPVTAQDSQLRADLASKCGEDIGAIFAVPHRQPNGALHWTDPLGADQTIALNELSGQARSDAEKTLREGLAKVEENCVDGPSGDLALGALSIENLEAIRVANGRPILAGWGGVPKSLTNSEELSRHHLATLGPFLQSIDPPQFSIAPVDDSSRPVTSLIARLRGPIIATLITAFVLFFLLLPGVLRKVDLSGETAGLPPELSVNYAEANRALEGQIGSLRRTVEGDVCTATGALTPRIVPLQDGGGDSRRGDNSSPANASPRTDPPSGQGRAEPTPPIQPNAVQVPPQSAPNQSIGSENLANFLNHRTVLIVTNSSTGSGFFVSPEYVLTNRHVIEDAGGRYLVGNKQLAQMLPADLVGSSDNSQIGQPDFALLKLKSGRSPEFFSFAADLPFQLQNVIAAGFPGIVLNTDANFDRLRNGDVHAVPDGALTSGAVVVVQNPESPTPIVLHRASISSGNSGGPLTDECGRVVGVNTFVTGSQGADDRMHYSLAATSAVRFLQKFGVAPTVVSGRCTTTAVASDAAASPPGAPSPNPRAPPPAAAPSSPAAPATPPSSAPTDRRGDLDVAPAAQIMPVRATNPAKMPARQL